MFDRAFINNPFGHYQDWLKQRIFWSDDFFGGGWVVPSHKDTVELLRDNDRFTTEKSKSLVDQFPSEYRAELNGLDDYISGWLAFIDPPKHIRIRRLLQKGFTPEILNSFRPRIEQIVDRLLDKVADKGEMDIIADLSYQLPVQVVGMMLGIPEKDHLRFMHWMDQIAMLMGSAKASVEDGRQAKEAFDGLTAYFKELLPQRREQPGRDLISILLAAEEEGDVLSEHELYANCVFFLFAGHETTSNLIGNGIYCLLKHPDQMARLRQNPALMPGLIEETLRFQSPFQFTFRMARQDFELFGKPVTKGQIVVFPFGASNRDPEVFERPNEFDIAREKNPHLTFSYGLHHCIGANTARLEASVAFSRLLARFEHIEPLFDVDNPAWHPVYRFRGFRTLPVRIYR